MEVRKNTTLHKQRYPHSQKVIVVFIDVHYFFNINIKKQKINKTRKKNKSCMEIHVLKERKKGIDS